MKTKSDPLQGNHQEIYVTVTHTDSTTSTTPLDPIINSLLEVKNEYLLMQQTLNKMERKIDDLESQLEGNKSKMTHLKT